ncbi:hypothetical protein [Roseobacter sinensis]|uniref:Uncharacterized protein n=1 Tax=Roseobacter sinensis TaxID=2931391 RepID=A0ABT3BDW7_9RHOB|nr:hypothetical protein [Roseobacter sp. WL0113]MCV3271773.1 hypothetical protein [Roseobacter sp. WL0113]
MMKLFGAFGPSSRRSRHATSDLRYTRFGHDKTRKGAAEEFRTPADETSLGAVPAQAERPMQATARPVAPPIDENAHLYSEAGVSTAVLRNALPQRFAENR